MQGREEDMKEDIAQATAEQVNHWTVWVLLGLGVSTIPVVEFFGGLFLAVGLALLVWQIFPEENPRKFWVVMATALAAGWVGALLMEAFWPEQHVQIGMAACGFGSKVLVNILYRMLGQVDERSKNLTDRIIDKYLPEDKD